MYRSRVYKPDEILQDRTFRDAIKNAYLLQFLQYGQCCNVKALIVEINGVINTLSFDDENRLLYPLCGYKLLKPLPHQLIYKGFCFFGHLFLLFFVTDIITCIF